MTLDETLQEIEERLSGTYICRDPLNPRFGVHTTFYKFPLQGLEEGYLQLLKNTEDRVTDVERVTHPDQDHRLPPDTTMIRAYGYWDTVAVKYTDDFATIADGGRLNTALAEKSFYGYLLATNSGASTEGLHEAPLREIHRLGQEGTGEFNGAVFSHFKLNPLLLYSGRTDLIVHAAEFIALIFAAPEELWEGPVFEEIKESLLKHFGKERGKAIDANLRRILPRASKLARGAKFMIFQDLDWNDFSCYVAAKTIKDAVNISSFIRSIPLLMPNLAFRYSAKALRHKGLKSKSSKKWAKGQKDLRELTSLIMKLGDLEAGRVPQHNEAKREETRQEAYELPVFWSHVDTVAPPQVGVVEQLDVYLGEIINAKPGQTHRLISRQGRQATGLSRFRALSGPKDLFRFIGRDQNRVPLAPERPRAAQKWTYVFSEIDLDMLYEGPEEDSISDSLGILLSQEFNKEDDWHDLNRLLGELGTPRQLTFSIRHLVLTHLAYKNDALMFNALYDYQHLWSNLKEAIQETIDARALRPDSADVTGLLRAMSIFAERVGQAINTRYHGTSRMFEVRDLSLNHRGGVDSFLDAYAQLVRISLAACNHIHHKSHFGIVNVTATPWPRVRTLFGCVVELDWLRLSNPETLFVVLHELGHQILSDKIFGLVRNSLPNASSAWQEVLVGDWKDTEKDLGDAGSFLSETSKVFSDIFCDLFMLHVLRSAVAGSEDDGGGAEDKMKSIRDFYDRWYWMMFECHLQQTRSVGRDGNRLGLRFVAENIIRWYIVSQVLKSWERKPWVGRSMVAIVDNFAEGIHRPRPRDAEGLAAYKASMRMLSEEMDAACEEELVEIPLPDLVESHLRLPRRFSPAVSVASRKADSLTDVRLALADMFGAGLQWFFRKDSRDVSPAQYFISLSELLLTVFVDHHLRRNYQKRKQLEVLGSALDYCQKMFHHSLDSSTERRPCYARFNEGGENPGSIQEADYTAVVINSRGTPYARGGALRLELFGERLAIFNQLAEGHLQAIVGQLLDDEGGK